MMTCAESRSLMLLRSDELTKEQAEEMRRHVKSCPNCTVSMQEVKNMARTIGNIRSFQPILKDPERLTSDILNEVEKARRGHRAASGGPADHLFELLSRRAARIAYGIFVLGSVGVFLTQQLAVATDVRSLEDKMLQRQYDNSGIQVLYAVPSNLVNRMPQSQQVRSYVGTAEAGEQDGLFVISGRGLAKAADLAGSIIFRSNNAFSNDASRKSLEVLAETLERSASIRVTIRPKERL